MFKKILMILTLALCVAPLRAADVPEREPSRLSDLYKFLDMHLERGLAPDLHTRHTVIGRSWMVFKTGLIHRVETELKDFEFQGLRFLKGNLEFVKLQVNREALMKWELQVESMAESRSSLVFSLKSLEKKLRDILQDPTLSLRADIAKQELEIKGKGSLVWVPAGYVARLKAQWDGDQRKLFLKPVAVEWAGMDMPGWLWWAGDGAWPEAPVLDLSSSWIPFNIQEVNLGWDRLSLSTDW